METILKYTETLFVIKLIEKIKNTELKSFISFFLTAVLGASVNFFSQIPYKSLFLSWGMNNDSAFTWSVFFGYLTATIVSFIPTKVFAFAAKESGNTRRESIKFVLIAFVALGVQIGMSSLALTYISTPLLKTFSIFVQEKFAHLLGMGCSFMANYFGHKFLTFRSTGIYDKIKHRNS